MYGIFNFCTEISHEQTFLPKKVHACVFGGAVAFGKSSYELWTICCELWTIKRPSNTIKRKVTWWLVEASVSLTRGYHEIGTLELLRSMWHTLSSLFVEYMAQKLGVTHIMHACMKGKRVAPHACMRNLLLHALHILRLMIEQAHANAMHRSSVCRPAAFVGHPRHSFFFEQNPRHSCRSPRVYAWWPMDRSSMHMRVPIISYTWQPGRMRHALREK
jgi:hypothetical protein